MTSKEVTELVEMFGLVVDYDQWDVEGKEWMRIKSEEHPDEFGINNRHCLILWKNDDRDLMIGELRLSIIEMGKNLKANELRTVLNLR